MFCKFGPRLPYLVLIAWFTSHDQLMMNFAASARSVRRFLRRLCVNLVVPLPTEQLQLSTDVRLTHKTAAASLFVVHKLRKLIFLHSTHIIIGRYYQGQCRITKQCPSPALKRPPLSARRSVNGDSTLQTKKRTIVRYEETSESSITPGIADNSSVVQSQSRNSSHPCCLAMFTKRLWVKSQNIWHK